MVCKVSEVRSPKLLTIADVWLGVGMISHTKCFQRRFAEVNSPKNPSTYPLLLPIQRINLKIRVGINLLQKDMKNTACGIRSRVWIAGFRSLEVRGCSRSQMSIRSCIQSRTSVRGLGLRVRVTGSKLLKISFRYTYNS